MIFISPEVKAVEPIYSYDICLSGAASIHVQYVRSSASSTLNKTASQRINAQPNFHAIVLLVACWNLIIGISTLLQIGCRW